jgi:hypothetical protein
MYFQKVITTKLGGKKPFFFVCILSAIDEKKQDPDPEVSGT